MTKKRILIFAIVIAVCAVGEWFYFERGASHSPIQAIEKARRTHVDEIVLQKNIDNGQVVFYLRNINDGQQVVSAEFVKRTLLGWKWGYGGGHTLPNYQGPNNKVVIDESWSYQYFPNMKGTIFGQSPFPMLFGAIKNPGIGLIEVKDLNTGKVQNAETVKTNGAVRFWYVFVTEEQGKKFTISAKTNDGKEISVKDINEDGSIQFSAGTPKVD